MKRTAIIIAMLGISAWSFGQNKPAAQTPPAGQTAAPAGKRPPQAKTQPEFEAYKAAAALTDPRTISRRSFPTASCGLCSTSR